MIGVVLFQLTRAVPEARRARAETVASFLTLRAASDVDEAIQDAERGQRGYLIIGRDSYLQPYVEAKARLPGLMTNLQRSVRDSPEQQPRLLTLQANVTTKMNELESTLGAYKERGYASARAIVETDLGRNAMEAIHADLTALIDSEAVRLTARSEQLEEADQKVMSTGRYFWLTPIPGLPFPNRRFGRHWTVSARASRRSTALAD